MSDGSSDCVKKGDINKVRVVVDILNAGGCEVHIECVFQPGLVGRLNDLLLLPCGDKPGRRSFLYNCQYLIPSETLA